jgi:hypothetical protein
MLMVRARLAALVLTSGLGLACGCSYLTNHPLFSSHGSTPCVGCESGSFPVTEGPLLQDSNPAVITQPGVQPGAPVFGVQPGAPGFGVQPGAPVLGGPPNGNGGLTPQPTVPPLSTPPRLVPQPQQAPVEPYRP